MIRRFVRARVSSPRMAGKRRRREEEEEEEEEETKRDERATTTTISEARAGGDADGCGG